MLRMGLLNREVFALSLLNVISFTTGFLVPDGLQRVNSKLGEIHGIQVNVEFDGQKYVVDKFLGIPYAEPPVGNLRFKKSKPLRQFPSTLKAVAYGPICPQLKLAFMNESMSEDCLTLNIFVPVPHGADVLRKPVMIWIHGGGFVQGSSLDYDSDILAAFTDVIVVTMNYRLGPLGFFSTSDSESPGNYGLWDQHLAIRWVKDNIAEFGGDRDNITIFGESAGSSSVVFQTLYAGNKGLFKRAIAESGTVSSWALSDNDSVFTSSIGFAKRVGCTATNHATLLACMRGRPTDVLINATQHPDFDGPSLDIHPLWIPVYDRDFVVEDPVHMLDNAGSGSPRYSFFREVDLMIGYNNYDGFVYFPDWMSKFNITEPDNFKVTTNQLKYVFTPRITEISLAERPSAASNEAVRKQYLANVNQMSADERLKTLADMATDGFLAAPSVKTAKAHSSAMSSTYMYRFDAKPLYRFEQLPSFLDREDTANHADELMFVFGLKPLYPEYVFKDLSQIPQPNRQQIQLSKAMMTWWTNFAKSGNPNRPRDLRQLYNTDWQTYSKERPKYLEITTNMAPSSLKDGPSYPAINFWNNVLPQVQDAV